ncbi:MAG: succinate dehydrogenase [bacterium]|nr:succinate dehydrogenase [bacterium]
MDSIMTNRNDFWWLSPLIIVIAGIIAGGYLTWAAFQGEFFEWGPYLSPVYSSPYVPSWWKLSPAFLLLWIPAGFRITCYYGRKTYYRAVFADPLACGVEEPYRKKYKGESKFPFILQNIHRYFLYFALILLVLHWTELILSVFYNGSLYFGMGTLIILLDTLALSFYVFGCHSLRHIVGGKTRCFSCDGCPKKAKISHGIWKKVSLFNTFHNRWFWISLFSVGVADLYIRLLAMGILGSDPHIIL